MIKSGFPFYGQNIAVLVFSTTIPRVAGDPGNNESFNYPVHFEILEGNFNNLLKYNDEVLSNISAVLHDLERKGFKAIIADCGLMSLYQNAFSEVKVPFIGSTLITLPLLWQIIGRQGEIGIITGHSALLTREHLLNSGWNDEIKILIQGMENEPHFNKIVILGEHSLDINKMKNDVINACEKLIRKSNNLKAIIIECSNLGTFSNSLNEMFEIPIVDIISVTNFIENIVNPTTF